MLFMREPRTQTRRWQTMTALIYMSRDLFSESFLFHVPKQISPVDRVDGLFSRSSSPLADYTIAALLGAVAARDETMRSRDFAHTLEKIWRPFESLQFARYQ